MTDREMLTGVQRGHFIPYMQTKHRRCNYKATLTLQQVVASGLEKGMRGMLRRHSYHKWSCICERSTFKIWISFSFSILQQNVKHGGGEGRAFKTNQCMEVPVIVIVCIKGIFYHRISTTKWVPRMPVMPIASSQMFPHPTNAVFAVILPA